MKKLVRNVERKSIEMSDNRSDAFSILLQRPRLKLELEN